MTIRQFQNSYADNVIALFRQVNRLLAPPGKVAVFEDYIEHSIHDEIGRIDEYYAEHNGGFWVALVDTQLVGMFGLEGASDTAMELRRMYVAPSWRRRGIARQLLEYAEKECVARDKPVLELSTSELQKAALQFYRNAGFNLRSEERAGQASNKTIGGGIRRYYFSKNLTNTPRINGKTA